MVNGWDKDLNTAEAAEAFLEVLSEEDISVEVGSWQDLIFRIYKPSHIHGLLEMYDVHSDQFGSASVTLTEPPPKSPRFWGRQEGVKMFFLINKGG